MTLNSQLVFFCSVKRKKVIFTNWFFHQHVDHIVNSWPGRGERARVLFCNGMWKRRGRGNKAGD